METMFASLTSSGITVSSFLICSLVALALRRAHRVYVYAPHALYAKPCARRHFTAVCRADRHYARQRQRRHGRCGRRRVRPCPFPLRTGNAKDISVIFVAMAVGLACGSGYIALSVLFTVIACAVLYLLVFFHIGADRSGEKELSITIPESLDYTEVFDDIFKEYTTHAELTEVKTASLGSLYKLHYRVRLADDRNEKEFLDALRCRNGNLEVRCGQPHTPVE